MTKKQFGIIFTLMALIVCVGVLSAKLNTNGLTDPTDLSQVLAGEGEQADKKADAKVQEKEAKEKEKADKKAEKNEKKSDKETLASQDYFFSQRSTKEQQNAATTQELKSISEDKNISQEKKDIATTELQEKIMIKDKEGRIELNVKNKGFEDVLCFIEGNKVRVVLKAEEQLTEDQTCAIQEIVEDVSSMSEVIIEPKK
ncbi:SpoIIIAH-like family protein [Clostridium gasigenes]|uniref:SpoIIIAH-like family protein n=1 Tax=Clostridium gasigenes TaxID=94869 RepID=A0A1H0MZP8_9CLOT|nr:SpoIIIAH-like family protein [Clostridium gasigenes]MBB6625181.1 SpoIIIAH-like family protein [Clostridium gasigenes]MBB6716185.1 SpoIIIAH-like family protein [Clostridium gasigenes]MBU3087373.1 SpoIIIAH-like family protein [Clostridium gasigenes]MBU3102902.1 SpoIIIAH-like family protein [Clostridium gasigenes]MBU3106612.1 SpoIIIAH-like family protein [Clostridium gasigenes]